MLVLISVLVAVALVAGLLLLSAAGVSKLFGRVFSYNLEGSVLGLPGLHADDGLGLSEIASALSDETPGVRRALQSLASQGHVERVPGGGERWRLTSSYRSLIDPPDMQQRGR